MKQKKLEDKKNRVQCLPEMPNHARLIRAKKNGKMC